MISAAAGGSATVTVAPKDRAGRTAEDAEPEAGLGLMPGAQFAAPVRACAADENIDAGMRDQA